MNHNNKKAEEKFKQQKRRKSSVGLNQGQSKSNNHLHNKDELLDQDILDKSSSQHSLIGLNDAILIDNENSGGDGQGMNSVSNILNQPSILQQNSISINIQNSALFDEGSIFKYLDQSIQEDINKDQFQKQQRVDQFEGFKDDCSNVLQMMASISSGMKQFIKENKHDAKMVKKLKEFERYSTSTMEKVREIQKTGTSFYESMIEGPSKIKQYIISLKQKVHNKFCFFKDVIKHKAKKNEDQKIQYELNELDCNQREEHLKANLQKQFEQFNKQANRNEQLIFDIKQDYEKKIQQVIQIVQMIQQTLQQNKKSMVKLQNVNNSFCVGANHQSLLLPTSCDSMRKKKKIMIRDISNNQNLQKENESFFSNQGEFISNNINNKLMSGGIGSESGNIKGKSIHSQINYLIKILKEYKASGKLKEQEGGGFANGSLYEQSNSIQTYLNQLINLQNLDQFDQQAVAALQFLQPEGNSASINKAFIQGSFNMSDDEQEGDNSLRSKNDNNNNTSFFGLDQQQHLDQKDQKQNYSQLLSQMISSSRKEGELVQLIGNNMNSQNKGIGPTNNQKSSNNILTQSIISYDDKSFKEKLKHLSQAEQEKYWIDQYNKQQKVEEGNDVKTEDLLEISKKTLSSRLSSIRTARVGNNNMLQEKKKNEQPHMLKFLDGVSNIQKHNPQVNQKNEENKNNSTLDISFKHNEIQVMNGKKQTKKNEQEENINYMKDGDLQKLLKLDDRISERDLVSHNYNIHTNHNNNCSNNLRSSIDQQSMNVCDRNISIKTGENFSLTSEEILKQMSTAKGKNQMLQDLTQSNHQNSIEEDLNLLNQFNKKEGVIKQTQNKQENNSSSGNQKMLMLFGDLSRIDNSMQLNTGGMSKIHIEEGQEQSLDSAESSILQLERELQNNKRRGIKAEMIEIKVQNRVIKMPKLDFQIFQPLNQKQQEIEKLKQLETYQQIDQQVSTPSQNQSLTSEKSTNQNQQMLMIQPQNDPIMIKNSISCNSEMYINECDQNIKIEDELGHNHQEDSDDEDCFQSENWFGDLKQEIENENNNKNQELKQSMNNNQLMDKKKATLKSLQLLEDEEESQPKNDLKNVNNKEKEESIKRKEKEMTELQNQCLLSNGFNQSNQIVKLQEKENSPLSLKRSSINLSMKKSQSDSQLLLTIEQNNVSTINKVANYQEQDIISSKTKQEEQNAIKNSNINFLKELEQLEENKDGFEVQEETNTNNVQNKKKVEKKQKGAQFKVFSNINLNVGKLKTPTNGIKLTFNQLNSNGDQNKRKGGIKPSLNRITKSSNEQNAHETADIIDDQQHQQNNNNNNPLTSAFTFQQQDQTEGGNDNEDNKKNPAIKVMRNQNRMINKKNGNTEIDNAQIQAQNNLLINEERDQNKPQMREQEYESQQQKQLQHVDFSQPQMVVKQKFPKSLFCIKKKQNQNDLSMVMPSQPKNGKVDMTQLQDSFLQNSFYQDVQIQQQKQKMNQSSYEDNEATQINNDQSLLKNQKILQKQQKVIKGVGAVGGKIVIHVQKQKLLNQDYEISQIQPQLIQQQQQQQQQQQNQSQFSQGQQIQNNIKLNQQQDNAVVHQNYLTSSIVANHKRPSVNDNIQMRHLLEKNNNIQYQLSQRNPNYGFSNNQQHQQHLSNESDLCGVKSNEPNAVESQEYELDMISEIKKDNDSKQSYYQSPTKVVIVQRNSNSCTPSKRNPSINKQILKIKPANIKIQNISINHPQSSQTNNKSQIQANQASKNRKIASKKRAAALDQSQIYQEEVHVGDRTEIQDDDKGMNFSVIQTSKYMSNQNNISHMINYQDESILINPNHQEGSVGGVGGNIKLKKIKFVGRSKRSRERSQQQQQDQNSNVRSGTNTASDQSSSTNQVLQYHHNNPLNISLIQSSQSQIGGGVIANQSMMMKGQKLNKKNIQVINESAFEESSDYKRKEDFPNEIDISCIQSNNIKINQNQKTKKNQVIERKQSGNKDMNQQNSKGHRLIQKTMNESRISRQSPQNADKIASKFSSNSNNNFYQQQPSNNCEQQQLNELSNSKVKKGQIIKRLKKETKAGYINIESGDQDQKHRKNGQKSGLTSHSSVSSFRDL